MLKLWRTYYDRLKELEEAERISLPYIPSECQHNGHIFYIKVKNLEERASLIQYLGANGIKAVFHYVPLHSSIAGKNYGEFVGQDRHTTNESNRLLRLPMFYALKVSEAEYIAEKVEEFYRRGVLHG